MINTPDINDPRPDQLIPTIVTMSRHNAASNVHDLKGIDTHNVSNLIYVPIIAPNTSVYPTAIVSSNHSLYTRITLLALRRCALVGRPHYAAHPALSAPM